MIESQVYQLIRERRLPSLTNHGVLTRPIEVRYLINSDRLINWGYEGLKYPVNLESHRKWPFFIRELNERVISKHPEASGQQILAKHRFALEIGLPVVPTLRFDPHNNLLLMTDITYNGKYEVVDKHNNGVRINNREDVARALLEEGMKAFKKGSYLDHDAYAILVDTETGLGKPFFLDLGIGSYLKSTVFHNLRLSFVWLPWKARKEAYVGVFLATSLTQDL